MSTENKNVLPASGGEKLFSRQNRIGLFFFHGWEFRYS